MSTRIVAHHTDPEHPNAAPFHVGPSFDDVDGAVAAIPAVREQYPEGEYVIEVHELVWDPEDEGAVGEWVTRYEED